jgi:hypothetical protein
MKSVREESWDVPLLAEADTIVAGGVPSGIGSSTF